MDERKPNILYLHSHDTGRWIRPYGFMARTPNLQHFAEEGVIFRNAYCVAPTCSSSRACLLTGQYAHNNGMMGLAHRGFSLNDYSHHIVHTLHQHGYFSALIGEQHISKDPQAIGYNEVIKVPNHRTGYVVPAALTLLARDHPQPFFLSVGFFETHREFFHPSSPKKANYVTPPPNLPDTPETRLDMAAYQESVRALDNGVGAILDMLDARDLAKNTLVICTTDHGLPFPGSKATLYDRGIGVMLLLRGPGGFVGGKAVDALVSQLDIFPTICEVAGIEKPKHVQGTSLLPLVNGTKETLHDTIFAEKTFHAAYEPARCARTQRWKYIRHFDQAQHKMVLANIDDSPSKDFVRQSGWTDIPVAEEQLFDLYQDPNEAHNLAADPAYAEVLSDMRGRLQSWMEETNDPLLLGPIAPPAGAMINDPEQISAEEATRTT